MSKNFINADELVINNNTNGIVYLSPGLGQTLVINGSTTDTNPTFENITVTDTADIETLVVHGNANVMGTTTLNDLDTNDLTVEHTSHLKGNVQIDSNLNVSGITTVDTLNTGSVDINDLTVEHTSHLKGNVQIDSNLNVSGITTVGTLNTGSVNSSSIYSTYITTPGFGTNGFTTNLRGQLLGATGSTISAPSVTCSTFNSSFATSNLFTQTGYPYYENVISSSSTHGNGRSAIYYTSNVGRGIGVSGANFTIQTSGVYSMSLTLRTPGSASFYNVYGYITVNGIDIHRAQCYAQGNNTIAISRIKALIAGNVVSFNMYQDSGVTIGLSNFGSEPNTSSIYRLF